MIIGNVFGGDKRNGHYFAVWDTGAHINFADADLSKHIVATLFH